MSREYYDQRGVTLCEWFKETGFTRTEPMGLLKDYCDSMSLSAIAYCCDASDLESGEEYDYRTILAKIPAIATRCSEEEGYSIASLSVCDGDETITVRYFHKDLLEKILTEVGADPGLLPSEGEEPCRDLIARITSL